MPTKSNREQYNSQLVNILTKILQNNLTGKLIINSQREKFNLYFKRGYFIYGTGGSDRVRRWYRAAKKYREIWQQLKLTEFALGEPWEYQILRQGFARNQLSQSHVEAIITTSTREILFTLISDPNYKNSWQGKNSIDNFCTPIDFKKAIFAPVKKLLQQQQELNLPYFLYPYFTPVRSNHGHLKRVSLEIIPLLNGKYSCWDIALQLKISIVELFKEIFPAYRRGLVKLQPLQDIDRPLFLGLDPKPVDSETITKPQVKPLIACIDDSMLICKQLEKTIAPAGYSVFKINQPLVQMLSLIEKKPALILLDLVMPNIDGYNLCKLLRKTPALRKTPIVILSSTINPLDRDRLLTVGATDFLTKPPGDKLLLETIKKHLPNKDLVNA